MHCKLLALGIITAAMTVIGHASAKELNSAELKALFNDTKVEFSQGKYKVNLFLNSNGKAKVRAVSPQGKSALRGKWWIKEPNIHCVRWKQRKKNICRPIGNVEGRGGRYSANVRGITWTIKKKQGAAEYSLPQKETARLPKTQDDAAMNSIAQARAKELKALFSNTTVKFSTKKAKVTLWLMSDGKARVHAVLAEGEQKLRGNWWIKEPNIHCLKWALQKKNICRPVGSVEKWGGRYSANVRGLTWTISSIKKPCPEGVVWNNCFGTYKSDDGTKYAGEWKDDKSHGEGTETYANGDKYIGEWKDGKRNGQGAFTYADGKVKKGIWENGEFLGAKP